MHTQGDWSKVALREGINRKELWVLKEATGHNRSNAKRKFVLVRMDNATAVARATHGAGRSSQLTRLQREADAREVAYQCTVAAPHVADKDDAIPDALSRLPIKASGGDSFPEREIRPRF